MIDWKQRRRDFWFKVGGVVVLVLSMTEPQGWFA